MKALRKLVLGETWSLPAGIAAAVLVAFAARELAGDESWWRDAGGFVLLGFLVLAFVAALALRR